MANKGMSVFRADGEDYTINDPNIANEFSAETDYDEGEYVNYQGNLYRFSENHAAGAWNAADVFKVTVGNEILKTRPGYGTVFNLIDIWDLENVENHQIVDSSHRVTNNSLYAAYGDENHLFPLHGPLVDTQEYTFSIRLKSNKDTGTVLWVEFVYADGTIEDAVKIPGFSDDYKDFSCTSRADKKLVGLFFTFGSSATLLIRKMQLEIGAVAHAFVNYEFDPTNSIGKTALDVISRTVGAGIYSNSFTLAAGGTHSSKNHRIGFRLIEGETYYIRVDAPKGQVGSTQVYAYVNAGDPDGERIESINTANLAKYIRFESPVNADSIGIYIRGSSEAQTVTFSIAGEDGLFGKVQKLLNDDGGDGTDTDLVVRLINAKMKANPYKRSNQADDPEVFGIAHFSDIHGHGDRLRAISNFIRDYGDYFDDTICTGDMIHDHFSESFDFWNQNSNGSILMCMGNHDTVGDGGWSEVIPQAQLYARYIQPYAEIWGAETVSGKAYYYKDYGANKIRLVVVDATINDAAEKAAQLVWLSGVLSDANENGLTVVGAVHYPPEAGANFEKIPCTFSTVLHGSVSSEAYTWDATLDAIQDEVDTFMTGGGNFACWLCGHLHHDLICYDARHPKQVFLGITCAWESDSYDEMSRAIDYTKNAMNIVFIDTVRKYIKVIRWGADYDDCLRKKSSMILEYGGNTPAVVFDGNDMA